jgi:hypothetical protein
MPLLEKLASLKGEKTPIDKSAMLPENTAPVAAANKDAPPSYAINDPVDSAGPTEAELNAAFASLNISSTPKDFPDADTCLAHLKLLSTFNTLKEDIGYTDGLFGLWDARCEMVENRDETLAKMREKRWALYIARAVDRFQDWWLNVLVNMEPSRRIEGKEMVATNADFVSFTARGVPRQWTTAMLPPIGGYSIISIDQANNYRCPHGLAFIHAQSSRLRRGLYSIWSQGFMGHWNAMDCC